MSRQASPHFMMGEECSLPQDVSTAELRTSREHDISPHPFATWVRDALEVAYDHVRESLQRTAACRKRLNDTKAVNRKFPVGSWVLCYYPPAAQYKLGSPWVGPQQVVRQATGHTVGIQKDPEKNIVFVRVDDLKLCPGHCTRAERLSSRNTRNPRHVPRAFQPGSHISDMTPEPCLWRCQELYNRILTTLNGYRQVPFCEYVHGSLFRYIWGVESPYLYCSVTQSILGAFSHNRCTPAIE